MHTLTVTVKHYTEKHCAECPFGEIDYGRCHAYTRETVRVSKRTGQHTVVEIHPRLLFDNDACDYRRIHECLRDERRDRLHGHNREVVTAANHGTGSDLRQPDCCD